MHSHARPRREQTTFRQILARVVFVAFTLAGLVIMVCFGLWVLYCCNLFNPVEVPYSFK